MTWKQIILTILVMVAVFVGLGLVARHNKYVEDHRQWSDVGTLSSVSLIPTSWNERNKTEIKTSDYTFVVVGVVPACKNGNRVFRCGNFVYLDGTGQTYELFDNNR